MEAARFLGVDYEVLADRPYLDVDRALVAKQAEVYARRVHEERREREARLRGHRF